jgi:hypothetical protein
LESFQSKRNLPAHWQELYLQELSCVLTTRDLQGRKWVDRQLKTLCDKMSTPPFFLYFCTIFPYQNNPMHHGQGDPTIGRPEDQPEDIRLDNHLHSWLARPTTLRLCQRRTPTVRMLIPYIGPPMTPQTTLRQSSIAGGPAHRPPYLRLYFPLVNTRPVPLLSGSFATIPP